MSANKTVLQKKAEEASLIYDDLTTRYGIEKVETEFVADESRKEMFLRLVKSPNPHGFPDAPVIKGKRKEGVEKIFASEKVKQTAAISGVLSSIQALSLEIAKLRGVDIKDPKVTCDVAYAGMQALRLYFTDYKGKEFRKRRDQSGISVDNALNGSFYKYKTKDNREVSFHCYYESQLEKLVKALGLKKNYKKYNLFSLPFDKHEVKKRCLKDDAMTLENLAFDSGACGCMLRTREEWETSEVGKAVKNMPLLKEEKVFDGAKPEYGMVDRKKGPLSGMKVLDLTHIIAGPCCSRLLGELGADVLMVRRGKFNVQEQAMLELDGWACKNSIQLDFNRPEELKRVKELIKQADIITYSYQRGCMDHFGLSEDDIRKLNPNIIFANLNCFSDDVWQNRPGWAPCAEDITGLSVRNGSVEKPVNLNGVPLDYFPGMILALGTLLAIRDKLTNGGGYRVMTSLTRGAQYLHEVTDLIEKSEDYHSDRSHVVTSTADKTWGIPYHYTHHVAVGEYVGFLAPGAVNSIFEFNPKNQDFLDGRDGFKHE
jgi:hypothetical protein